MKQPTIHSEISSSGLICQLEILSASPKPWYADPANPLNEARTVGLQLRILEQIKGPEVLVPGTVLPVEVVQRRPANGRMAEDYGPWSLVDLAAGTQLLALCSIPGKPTTLSKALAENCQLLITAETPTYPHALEDTRRATAIAADAAFPASLQTAATQKELLSRRRQIGPLFTRFLIENVERLEPAPYSLLFQLLDAHDTEPMSRVVIVDYFREQLSLDDQPRERIRVPLIRAMAHILTEQRTTSRVLQEGIEQAYLYNITFNGAEQPFLRVDIVFPDAKEREAIAVAAKSISDDERRNRFVAWLKSG